MFHNDVVKTIVNKIPYYYYNHLEMTHFFHNLKMTHLLRRERRSTTHYGGDPITFCNVPRVNVNHKYYEGDVVTLCNGPRVNIGYKYYFPL